VDGAEPRSLIFIVKARKQHWALRLDARLDSPGCDDVYTHTKVATEQEERHSMVAGDYKADPTITKRYKHDEQ
jgi:hypothetical protein